MATPAREEVTVRRGKAAAAEEAAEVARPVARPATRGITALTAEELGAELSGDYATPPDDVQEQVQSMLDNFKASLVDRTSANVQRALAQRERGAAPEIGEPFFAGYEFWDIFAVGPQQLIFPPFTFQPQKIVAGGELVLHVAVLFINPLATPGGGPSATQYLGNRGFRVRFEQIDLTNVVKFTSFTFVGTFPSPAPVISVFPVFTVPANPGPNPRLVELNVTADITDPAQPIAAFGTQWFDIEEDPGFPLPIPPGFKQVPLRYLIYPE